MLDKAAKANNLTLLESTLRWMRHHSGLGAKDGIIIGASSIQHLEANLTDLDKGPLPQAMIEAFDEAWELVKPVTAPYYRGPEMQGSAAGLLKDHMNKTKTSSE